MDETEVALTREMELTRMDMAALTDSLNRLNHSMNPATAETHCLGGFAAPLP